MSNKRTGGYFQSSLISLADAPHIFQPLEIWEFVQILQPHGFFGGYAYISDKPCDSFTV